MICNDTVKMNDNKQSINRIRIIQSKKESSFIVQYTVYGATQTDKQHQ